MTNTPIARETEMKISCLFVSEKFFPESKIVKKNIPFIYKHSNKQTNKQTNIVTMLMMINDYSEYP